MGNLTITPPSEPLKRSTGAAVRDHRNAVRDRSERCPQSIGITVRFRRNPQLDNGLARQPVAFAPHQEISNAIPLFAAIGNRTHEPALYTLVKIMIDAEIQVGNTSGFGRAGTKNDDNGHPMTIYSYNLAIPVWSKN